MSPVFAAYARYFSSTIRKASWLILSLRFSAFAMVSSVLSSKVGPKPPVVSTNCGLRFNVSVIACDVSLTLSGRTVIRLTVMPRFVACLASH